MEKMSEEMNHFLERKDIKPLVKFFVLLRWETSTLSKDETVKQEIWKKISKKL